MPLESRLLLASWPRLGRVLRPSTNSWSRQHDSQYARNNLLYSADLPPSDLLHCFHKFTHYTGVFI